MFKIKDYVVYKRDVCEIIDIKRNEISGKDYYILVPVSDKTLKIDVPVNNELGNIRKLITKSEINDLIKRIPSIPIIENTNKLIESDYKELLKDGSFESLIRIIKTTYLRNKTRLDNKKRKGDKDYYYFNLAEKYLYTEFSIVLGKSFDETKEFIIQKVNDLDNK